MKAKEELIFCKDCNNVWTPPFSIGWAHCGIVKKIIRKNGAVRPTFTKVNLICSEANKNNDCKYYQPKTLWRRLVTCLDDVENSW